MKNGEDPYQIREAIRSIVNSLGLSGRPNWLCEVKEVDWGARTCTVMHDESMEFFDVRLRSVADGETKGMCLRPAIGSMVMVEQVEELGTDVYVSQYSEVDEIEIEIGGTKVNIKDGLVSFNDGNNKGLVKLTPTVQKLNALEKDLNNVKTALKSLLTTPVLTAAPGSPDAWQAAMIAGLTAWANDPITLTVENDLENDKVKH